MPICRCEEVRILRDVPADDYTGHLVREGVGPTGETVSYRCPQTDRKWLVEFAGDDVAGLSMTLRQMMTAVELLEWLTARSDLEETLEWTHPEVEFNLPGETTMHRGIDEARRIARRRESERPTSRALSLVPVSPQEAVVLGDMVFRRDGDEVEHRPCAWLVGLRDGRIGRSRWFESWAEARRVAGLPKHPERRAIRTGPWFFALRGPRLSGRPAT